MSLKSDLKTLIEGLYSDATVIFDSFYLANRESLDKLSTELTVAKPFIECDIVNANKQNEIQDNYNVLSSFSFNFRVLVQSKKENTVEYDYDNYYTPCEAIVDKIVANIYALVNTRLKGTELLSYNVFPVYKIHNSILSGAECNMNFKQNKLISC